MVEVFGVSYCDISIKESDKLFQIISLKIPRLKSLTLFENNLVSLELIQRESFPHLDRIYVPRNKITSMKSLSKFQAPNLRTLCLHSNLFVETDFVTLLDFKNVSTFFKNHNKSQFYVPIESIVKMNAKAIELTDRNVGEAIQRYELLKRKYPKLEFFDD